MALTQASLSGKIQAEIQSLYGTPADGAKLKNFCDAIAKAVVDEIQQNAQVSGTVTSGVGAGGSVTGTVS
jgi:hypothetical protein